MRRPVDSYCCSNAPGGPLYGSLPSRFISVRSPTSSESSESLHSRIVNTVTHLVRNKVKTWKRIFIPNSLINKNLYRHLSYSRALEARSKILGNAARLNALAVIWLLLLIFMLNWTYIRMVWGRNITRDKLQPATYLPASLVLHRICT